MTVLISDSAGHASTFSSDPLATMHAEKPQSAQAKGTPPLPGNGAFDQSAKSASARARRRERYVWWGALSGSIAVHAAVAAFCLLNFSSRAPERTAPPAAMVVDLAVMPSSPAEPDNQIPPGPKQVQAAPQPKPQDQLKFDPPPQADPRLNPTFALPQKQEVKPVETPVVASEARETTAPPSVQAPIDDKSKAPAVGNNSAPPSDAEQAWEGRVLARLERSKRYPASAQSAGQEDTVYVRLVIDRKGKLIDAALRKTGPYATLDAETLALAHRASPFPQPPTNMTGDQIVLVVPIEYYIKKRR